MAKKKSTSSNTPSRGHVLQSLPRAEAIAEIFRRSAGKKAFTCKSMHETLNAEFPHLRFSNSKDSFADTLTRMMDQLMETGFPIRRTTAGKSELPVEGSSKQVVWIYEPGAPGARTLEDLSDIPEFIDNLIGLAVAAEATAPLAGLGLHDNLAALQQMLAENGVAPSRIRKAKRTVSKYKIGLTSKRRGTLEENRKRDLLRQINQCVANELRLKIWHKHEFGQREEKEYTLEPHGLVPRNGSVYLIAHVVGRDNLHQFKLDRISKAVNLKTPNTFEYNNDGNLTGRRWPADMIERPPFPLDKVLGRTIHNYLPRADERPVTNIEIEVRKERAKWVSEELINPRQTTSKIRFADGSEGLRVLIPEAFVNDITPRILGLGPYVKVVGPPELAEHIRATLQDAVQQYVPPITAVIGEGGKPPAPCRRK